MTAGLSSLLGSIRVGVAFRNAPTDDPTLFTWDSTPGQVGAAGQWTDITEFVYGYGTSDRGRQHDLQEVEAGELTLNLDNTDSRFSPWYSAGPYVGLLQPKKWVAVQVKVGATYYSRFTGHVSAWAPQWNDPFTTQCQIQAYDPCRLWNSALLVSNAYSQQVLADGAAGYWRLDDVVGTVAADASGNNNPATYTNGATLLQPSLLLSDGDYSAALPGAGYVAIPAVSSVEMTTIRSVECWIETTAVTSGTAGTFFQIFSWGTASTVPPGVSLTWDTGTNNVAIANCIPTSPAPNTSEVIAVTGSNLSDGNPHHFVATYDNTGAHEVITFYVDGVSVYQLTDLSSSYLAAAGQFFFGGAPQGGAAGLAAFPVTLDELAVYSNILTAAQVANHYSLGVGGMIQEDTDDRIAATAKIIGWASTALVLDDGAVTCQANTEDITQTSALTMAQQAEATEGGGASLYFGAEGKLHFLNRRNMWQEAPYNVSQLTFGDAPTELHFIAGPQLPLDDVDIYNQAIVQPNNGNPYTVNNTTSQVGDGITTYGYGVASWQPNATPLNLPADSLNPLTWAQWVVNTHGVPLTRVDTITVDVVDALALDGGTAGTVTAALMALDVGSRITLNRHNMPANPAAGEFGAGNPAFSQQFTIEQVSETVATGWGGDASWQMTFTLSATEAAFIPWIVGDSTYGVAGTAIAGP